MSLATLAPLPFVTMADLLDSLGQDPARADPRCSLHRERPRKTTSSPSMPGRKSLCELVDGVLVEKPMGYEESRLAIEIGFILGRIPPRPRSRHGGR